MNEKQDYAKALGFELGEDEEWPRRCENCVCWGKGDNDPPAMMNAAGAILRPCRRGPPHVMWPFGHLIDTTDDNFGFSQWPYTAAHWCCPGWAATAEDVMAHPHLQVAYGAGKEVTTEGELPVTGSDAEDGIVIHFDELTMDVMKDLIGDDPVTKIEINKLLLIDLVQNMSTYVDPEWEYKKVLEGHVGTVIVKGSTVHIWTVKKGDYPPGGMSGIGEDGTVYFVAKRKYPFPEERN